ncbi:hypothetical protein Francci3_0967 [Frankia casuarinae]|uniref:Uncharacterized protein n=1 Tax=Frankia casuarinae (strain DSM 45818 / CECT 9043 / HFP020203 / CcI3) TaxID=106370 RepID=Q2JEE1_FRACC|nr:hypothetical protein Francci3_0967 [Frankia casuarinae]
MGQVDGNPIFTIDFDFVGHELVVQRLDGERISFPLVAQSVASFYRRTFDALAALGIKIRLDHPHPCRPPARGPRARPGPAGRRSRLRRQRLPGRGLPGRGLPGRGLPGRGLPGG